MNDIEKLDILRQKIDKFNITKSEYIVAGVLLE